MQSPSFKLTFCIDLWKAPYSLAWRATLKCVYTKQVLSIDLNLWLINFKRRETSNLISVQSRTDRYLEEYLQFIFAFHYRTLEAEKLSTCIFSKPPLFQWTLESFLWFHAIKNRLKGCSFRLLVMENWTNFYPHRFWPGSHSFCNISWRWLSESWAICWGNLIKAPRASEYQEVAWTGLSQWDEPICDSSWRENCNWP